MNTPFRTTTEDTSRVLAIQDERREKKEESILLLLGSARQRPPLRFDASRSRPIMLHGWCRRSPSPCQSKPYTKCM